MLFIRSSLSGGESEEASYLLYGNGTGMASLFVRYWPDKVLCSEGLSCCGDAM